MLRVKRLIFDRNRIFNTILSDWQFRRLHSVVWENKPETMNHLTVNNKSESLFQKHAFKLVNDFALTQKTCVCFACVLVAYL